MWLEYADRLGPITVTAIAGAFGVHIAWRHWKTADDQLALDLRKERMQIVEGVQTIVSYIVEERRPKENHSGSLQSYAFDAYLLFNLDISNYIRNLSELVLKFNALSEELRSETHPFVRTNLSKEQIKCLREIEKYFTEFPPLIYDYVVMRHKLSTPSWWQTATGAVTKPLRHRRQGMLRKD
jgi:hypothetical protein